MRIASQWNWKIKLRVWFNTIYYMIFPFLFVDNKWLIQIQLCIKCVKIWDDVDKWSNNSQIGSCIYMLCISEYEVC